MKEELTCRFASDAMEEAVQRGKNGDPEAKFDRDQLARAADEMDMAYSINRKGQETTAEGEGMYARAQRRLQPGEIRVLEPPSSMK